MLHNKTAGILRYSIKPTKTSFLCFAILGKYWGNKDYPIIAYASQESIRYDCRNKSMLLGNRDTL